MLGSGGAFLVTSFEGESTPFSVLDDAGVGGGDDHGGWLVHGDELSAAFRRAPGGAQVRQVRVTIRRRQ